MPRNETEETDVSIPDLFENLEDFFNQTVAESEDLDLHEKKEVYDPMGVSSQPSFENFFHCVESIITKHGTSHKEASEWLQLSRLAFPNFENLSSRLRRRYFRSPFRLTLEVPRLFFSRVYGSICSGSCCGRNANNESLLPLMYNGFDIKTMHPPEKSSIFERDLYRHLFRKGA